MTNHDDNDLGPNGYPVFDLPRVDPDGGDLSKRGQHLRHERPGWTHLGQLSGGEQLDRHAQQPSGAFCQPSHLRGAWASNPRRCTQSRYHPVLRCAPE